MRATSLKLNKILDLEKWQTLQDSLAQSTKLAIITVDHRGIPLTAHSEPRPFCQFVRANPDMVKFCHKCDSRAGMEALRTNAPFIYLCHRNIVDAAIPIAIDDKYVGAIMAGQVRLPENESVEVLEQILTSPDTELLSAPKAQQMYSAIPVLSYNEVRRAAQMLFDLSNYIATESMNKHLIMELYERTLPLRAESSLESLKREIGAGAAANAKPPPDPRFECKNAMLRPAFDYIFDNMSENISQKKMAELCSISAGHFSRLFAKETGETFTAYLSRQKVERSKQFLENSELTITQISDELGFSEPGYYIKVFKKYENITPSLYRKHFSP